MKTPLLGICIDGDKRTPHSSTVKLLDKLALAKKNHLRSSALKMQTKSLNHFNWVDIGDQLATPITNWIAKQRD